MPEKPPENNTENNPEPKSPESELSQEVLERVMAKVQDIGSYPTAFTAIEDDKTLDTTKNVLQYGLLGSQRPSLDTGDRGDRSKEKWAYLARKTKKNIVHFNIVGRTILGAGQEERNPVMRHIGRSYWTRIVSGSEKGFVILFNSKEFADGWENDGEKDGLKRRTYYQRGGFHEWETRRDPSDEWYGVGPIPDSGFVMRDRIAPRFFKGIIPVGKTLSLEELVLLMFEIKTFLPIFDSNGNLLWPQKMSYEEVKKFVEERDKNKEKK
ncbi:hypothetical protein A3B05_01305 [Candidatus Giovannonibacteria bacterium RIFCSPLOWO2_01_FULL_43_160]|uniref:Uncharacterized protein n=2 Tax=Candidatus Giovannoniibacteriota TaxID=1752738 RepID=A0A0G1LUC3_9BACT|nr:MAG: hypothetical protein UV72_C0004G0014 [Candidatus Giovannonibacteria bacterium GW2011_GWB1_43_13]KKS99325.1 MAG: hypothetical protein UV75_C0006G0014 [Candidatus Giovannonibacteria bacterium GW2011_GWA1_43_15]KKT21732.1 MAG: hypothetical protein UW05_C0004G0026 [Candidatus Giovannonibacteria bacterium GW2011_GWC2_43_8]KKT63299.1 MAG: hypothetical protein UW55_C0005G0014 [Candidatus Giovannonibacteria bacterium GW2011_GWA2_44_26]OGF59225.1 MAG: hypothetical protein A2652_00790 [Candidatus